MEVAFHHSIGMEKFVDCNGFKVFVSRLPHKWTEGILWEHFEACFGNVARAEVFTTRKVERKGNNMCYAFQQGLCTKGEECIFSHEVEERGLGSGAVYFHSEGSMQQALAQGSLHVSHKTVKISEFLSRDDGRDTTTCYAWQTFNCTHGEGCKFSHDGPGGLAKVGEPGAGKKCISYKTKGKCSKGDSCPFVHSVRPTTARSQLPLAITSAGPVKNKSKKSFVDTSSKLCINFKKKGKCRKGSDCPFDHGIVDGKTNRSSNNGSNNSNSNSSSSDSGGKRKRITGGVLVNNKKKLIQNHQKKQEQEEISRIKSANLSSEED